MVKEIKSKTIFFSDVKRFIRHLNYRIYILQLAILFLFGVLICAVLICHRAETEQIQLSNQKLLNRLDAIEKKIDFRYYNTTRSLEEINDVRIDTQSGSLRR